MEIKRRDNPRRFQRHYAARLSARQLSDAAGSDVLQLVTQGMLVGCHGWQVPSG